MFISDQLLSDMTDIRDISLGSVQEIVDPYEHLHQLNLPIFSNTSYNLYMRAEKDLKEAPYRKTTTIYRYDLRDCDKYQILESDSQKSSTSYLLKITYLQFFEVNS